MPEFVDEDETTPLLRDDPRGNDFQDDNYKSRWRSIRVMYFTMFLSSVGFTIVITSLWPYLQKIDDSANATFLGWVVAAYSLGQMVASPLFGLWSNHRPRREPLVCSILINLSANIYYAYAYLPRTHNKYHILMSRAFVGFGAGNVAVVRSYVAGATSLKERTNAMANMSACQALGFILGPALQAGLTFIGELGYTLAVIDLKLNMYTAPALLATIFGVINILLVVLVLREHRVNDDGQHIQAVNYISEDQVSITEDSEENIDRVAAVTSNVLFFIVMFIFAVFETIATPLSMDMFAWTRKEAVFYNGIIICCIGFESILVFLVVKVASQRPEKQLVDQSNVVQRYFGADWLSVRANVVPVHARHLPGSVHLLGLPYRSGLPGLQCNVLHALFQNPWTQTTGRVHGLADCIWQRSADFGPRVCLARLHPPRTTLGICPHLHHGRSRHRPPQRRLPQTYRLLCTLWEGDRLRTPFFFS
ncbi:major facilitator superfamily domain-containing protein 8 isoform X2 [Nerophis ophidion]|uniref:major facilitator superfamily domain-containing protein 8 isoform X2 n=1 Tax=Nerophis ophidion TaxID=159077 RepID=UPI002AE073E7|nr:major facilitator superfamily domain-containing protein 8 isoform X2 [Nerophis ophidion]